jgi:PAS domain S-box-containing protein
MSNAFPQPQFTAPTPDNEPERLAALQRYNVLDTPPEAAFDRITQLAARLFNVPTALISLVDESRAWFKSCVGFDVREVPRDNTLCSFNLSTDEPLIVPDTRLDDRFASNPFVQAEPGVRFFAGAPLLNHDGFNLGTLCLLDSQPHDLLTPEQQATLVDLAAMVVDELELRLAVHQTAQSEEKYRTLFESIDEGFCTIKVLVNADDQPIDHQILQANPAFEQQFGITNPAGKTVSKLLPGGEQYWNDLYTKVIDTGKSIRTEVRLDALNRWFDILVSRVGDAAMCQVAVAFTDISDRKQAEAILQQTSAELESQVQKFDAIATSIPDFIYTFDLSGRFTYISQSLLDLWQKSSVEAVGKNFFELDYPTDLAARLQHQIQQVIETRQPVKDETPYTSAVGTRAYEYIFVPLFDATGAVEAVAGVTRDITERKQAEAILQQTSNELERQVRKFDATLSTITDSVFSFDRDGRFLYANQVLLDLWGIAAAEAIGKTMADLNYPPAVERQVLDDLQRVIETRESVRNETPYTSPAGVEGYFEYILSPVIADDRTVESIVGLSRDTSDRKQSEELLRQSESHLRLMIESAKDYAIFTLDLNGIVTTWNAGAERLLQYSEAEIIGQNSRIIFTPEDRAEGKSERELQIALTQGRAENERWHLRKDSSRFWGSGIVMPLQDEAGNAQGFVKIMQDKTTQRRAEAEREQLLQREQAARETAERANQIKDEFLAVLSHELRSPLNPILGWTQLLRKGILDETRQQEALATIERNAKLQTQLIEDLLDISRIMQGKLSLTVTPVNLTSVITAAVETVRLAAEVKNIQILLDLVPESISVTGDAARLQQVVWNLLTNAVKFTPNGGQVTIELRQLDRLAQIRVIDTGKGIDPQFLPYVFEYFRQADATTTRKFGGLGLGLAIVRQIIEMHGGTVWAESEGENRGAIFTVQLPVNLQEELSETTLPHNNLTTEAPLSNLQILLVDDEPDAREFQTFLLEQSGASVTAVASAFEALQSLDRSIPDMLISDVGMAEMDGYMLIQQIRSRPRDRGGMIPAIALTAYARDFDQQKALQSGFQAHITKPVEPVLLVAEIAKLLKSN